MTTRRETDELIERYCMGLLNEDEKRIFDQWKDSDPDMAIAVDEYLELAEAFKVYGSRVALKEKLNAIHDEMETENFRFKAPLEVVAVKNNRVVSFVQRYRRFAAIAAVITVVAVSATILTFSIADVSSSKQRTDYQELRREVESIKRSQNAIIRDINTDNVKPADGAVQSFSGTGFAISDDGYVLTSSHVVEGAREIYISNQKHQQLKVKMVYTDKHLDLAVLKVDQDSFAGFGTLPFIFKKSVADPGDKVFTLGYPREDLVYGEGSISSYTGYEGDTASYQISIPVNPGNSGGPLFDGNGNLLGIISGRNAGAEGASFAVKSRWITDHILNHREQAEIHLPQSSKLRGSDRTAQVKKLRDYVFMVKVYN